ncbi:hypothetical protein NL108_016278 [Boleophthalmus pectinirostris]|uniref:uncharacterized protein zgc:101664 isoform X2 n=1 Tax=Boleophthalmus pectinirostris TaxID=150288 RepID=UPI00242CC278|nr:uncharacterized protein zgc:101664 isoform X2 [Boleophthalmus pectinirostris]KAJ0068131.1 hypothetical protein NL108_016278 [Boleophthalmus pectinirostris]
MEDVVLRYKSGPDQDVSALIGTTERLLAPFPCRPPQVFSPWFPSVVDRHLPLRPARPPPRILSAPDPGPEEDRGKTGPNQHPNQDPNQTGPTGTLNQTTQGKKEKTGPTQGPKESGPKENLNQTREETGPPGSPDQTCGVSPQTGLTQGPVNSTSRALSPRVDQRDVIRTQCPFVPETPPDPDPGPQARTRPGSKPDSPSKRCWTVFGHRVPTKDRTRDQTRVRSRVQTSSRHFTQTLSKLRLHPRHRVKWILHENNCRDIEQVWRSLSRPARLSLPSSCNAHFVRDQAQIWVYCDLVQSEEVGLSLKEDLSLRGTICLWERRHGNIYSL